MPLDFGEHEDVVFDHAPLLSVLCQVKFSPVLSLLTQAGVTGFQAGLRDRYPKLLPVERSANVMLGAEGVGVQTAPPVWRLTDDAEKWTVGLAVDFVSLETPAYTHIEDFLERFSEILSVLRSTIRPSESVRIGLRKVNAINLPIANRTESLVGLVRPEMVGPLAADEFPVPVSGFVSQLEFTEFDFNHLVVRYGLQTRDSVTQYVLDIDYFTEHPYEIDGREDFLSLLRHFSEGITSFFHWAMDDGYKNSLGPRPRGEVQTTS